MIKFLSGGMARSRRRAAVEERTANSDSHGRPEPTTSALSPLQRHRGKDRSTSPTNASALVVGTRKFPPSAKSPLNAHDMLTTDSKALGARGVMFPALPDATIPNHGDITESIYDGLLRAGKAHYCHRDDDAIVLVPPPMTEHHQKAVIRATIDSANRFAIITSYNINPLRDNEPDKISATMFAILESLAKRQSDKDFSFVLLYNDNKLQTNAAVSALLGQNVVTNMTLQSRSKTSATTTWPAVVEAYNRQQSNETLKIRTLDCSVYFVPAKAKGVAGSHHNKFCINDSGVAATLGASIANKTKDSWLDSGCVTISESLAARQRDYFLNDLVGGHKVRCGRLQMDALGHPVIEKLSDEFVLEGLRDIPVRAPTVLSESGTNSRFHQAFASAGISLAGTKHKVLWIQNLSSGYKNKLSSDGRIEDKPIGYALSAVFNSAVRGDTINIVNKTIGDEGTKLITNALKRGCDVNIIIDRPSMARLEQDARRFYANSNGDQVGRLNIRYFSPTPQFARAHGLNETLPPVAHSKTYLVERANGSNVVMTGTYNLDGQSHYRSNENAMLFETRDNQLIRGLFRDVYDGCATPVSSWPASTPRASQEIKRA